MNLLVITQKVDIKDGNLGFFHRWLEKFAEKVENLYVICLWQGEYHLPENVKVFSLGKERGISKIGQLIRLQKYLIKILPRIDGIFIHMCPIYAIASFPLTKIFRKKMILWFLHRSVEWKLKLAEKCVDSILTASAESCRLKNRKKIEIIGHGIDVDRFRPAENSLSFNKSIIFSAGRIAPSKDLETLIRAVDILVNQKNIKNILIKIAGSPLINSEKRYFEKIKNLIHEKKVEGYIEFLGSVPNTEMLKYYQEANIFINLSHTGSIDKVVLEAMACAVPVLTCNEAFQGILDEKYFFKKKDYQGLTEKIINLRDADKDNSLREIVVRNHDLDDLIKKIIKKMKNE